MSNFILFLFFLISKKDLIKKRKAPLNIQVYTRAAKAAYKKKKGPKTSP